jgi:Glycosyl transferase family 11
MIGIQLKGRLGNQMFQYAAARTLAEKLGCLLLVAGNTPTRRFGLLAHMLRLDCGSYAEMRQNGKIHEAFGCGPSFVQGRLCEIALPWLHNRKFSSVFTPKMTAVESESFEEFDDRFFTLKSGTWLDGLFQSSAYFASNEERVRQWFCLRPRDQARVEGIVAQWPKPPYRMVSMHVRRGDYLRSGGVIGSPGSGWALPLEYYRVALASLPRGTGVALFSDDPDWAADAFKEWEPWVSRTNSAAVDMMAMGRSRWIVTANSSFSWWGAWLNFDVEKTIFAPKFHLGFRLQRWVPDGIAVDGWRYLEVA